MYSWLVWGTLVMKLDVPALLVMTEAGPPIEPQAVEPLVLLHSVWRVEPVVLWT